jgi:hypothetical protein
VVAAEKGRSRGQPGRAEEQGGQAQYANFNSVDMSRLIPLDPKHRNSVPPASFPPQDASHALLNSPQAAAGGLTGPTPMAANSAAALFPPQGTSDVHLISVLQAAASSLDGTHQANRTTSIAATSTAAAGCRQATVRPDQPNSSMALRFSAWNGPTTGPGSRSALSATLPDPKLPVTAQENHPDSFNGSQSSALTGYSAIQATHSASSIPPLQPVAQPWPRGRSSSLPPDGGQAHAGAAMQAASLPPDPKVGVAMAHDPLPLTAGGGNKRKRGVSAAAL